MNCALVLDFFLKIPTAEKAIVTNRDCIPDCDDTHPLLPRSQSRPRYWRRWSHPAISETSSRPASSLENRLRKKIEEKNVEIANLRKALKSFYERMGESIEKQEKLEAENNRLIQQRQEDQDGKNSLRYELLKDCTIWALHHKVMELEKQQEVGQNTTIDERVIDQAMEAVGIGLESLMDGFDTSATLTVPGWESTRLLDLTRILLKKDSQPPDTMGRLRESISMCSTGVVLRSFCVAALQHWVFESDFPTFEDRQSRFDSQDVSLLEEYRESILRRDSMIMRYPERQSRFVRDFLVTLGPMFLPAEDHWKGVWTHDLFVSEVIRSRLKKLFEIALQFKAATIVTDQVFKFEVYPPGTSHDQGDLTRDATAGMRAETGGWRN
ncbi:hypothetical protein BDZ45DRAFT_729332 [Acephala macrosclerotiorum]|nr:hypothetical protein BDZ45DRAFT_729332 [Acephala macrosclerotiorum]